MDAVSPQQIIKILEFTDSIGLHRETVYIPLSTADQGSVTVLPDHKLRIVVPRNKPFDEWFLELKTQLKIQDLSSLQS